MRGPEQINDRLCGHNTLFGHSDHPVFVIQFYFSSVSATFFTWLQIEAFPGSSSNACAKNALVAFVFTDLVCLL